MFVLRSLAHHAGMSELIAFFDGNAVRREIVARNPWIFEQVTRQIFYRRSTFRERMSLIKAHYLLFENCFTTDAMRSICLGEGLELWRGEFQDSPVSLKLCCNSRDRREGLATMVLKLGNHTLYRMIVWAGPDKDGRVELRIGSLQGAAGRLKTYRDLTKHFFGYRPKNLVLYALRMVARKLQAARIQAISNSGFFANNHLRADRKLQTSLNEFWQEAGGEISADPRFFDLPIAEPRKRMEETKSHKHTLYRNRFALIDEIDRVMAMVLDENMNPPGRPASPAKPAPGKFLGTTATGSLSHRPKEQVMS